MPNTATILGDSAPQFHAPGLYGCIHNGSDGSWLCPENLDEASRRMQAAHSSSLPATPVDGSHYRIHSTGDSAPLPGGGHVALIGRMTFRTSDLRKLESHEGSAAALARAYERKGSELTELIDGHFSYIIVDAPSGQVHAGVDRLGTYPLYYVPVENGLIWGTDSRVIMAHPYLEKQLCAQSIYNYIYFHMVPAPDSIFQELRRLQNAHCFSYDGRELSLRRYWLPNFNAQTQHRKASHDDFQALRNHLETAVRRCIEQQDGKVGAFLSGGLDSSSVVGMLAAQQAPGSAKAFAIGFDAPGYDEMAYARITAGHFGVELNEYYVTPDDVVEALPHIAVNYDEPFGNSSALPAYFCARFAREKGVNTLLAGDGGDELFAGNERYAKQLWFERYMGLPNALRKPLESMARLVPAQSRLGRKGRSFMSQAHTPLPGRLHTYNFLNQFDTADIFTKEWIDSISSSYPETLQQEVFEAPEGSALDRMLYLDWQFTLADNDLRKVSHMCALAGIKVHYPMLDEDLLRFSCQIPDHQKLRNNELRYFYKQAMRGWLPDETIRKKKQGFGLPFGMWMREHAPLADMANDALTALANRKIFNDAFLNNARELHQNAHAAYYGELIWILMMLELWLEGHD